MNKFKFIAVTFFVLFSFNVVQADPEPLDSTGLEVETLSFNQLKPGDIVFINNERGQTPVVIQIFIDSNQISVRDFEGVTSVVKESDLLTVGGRADRLVAIESFGDEKDHINLKKLITEWGRTQLGLDDTNQGLQRAEVEMETARRRLEEAKSQVIDAHEQASRAYLEALVEKEAQRKKSDALLAIERAQDLGRDAREALEEASRYEEKARASEKDYNDTLEQLRNQRSELSSALDDIRALLKDEEVVQGQIKSTEEAIRIREVKNEDNLREELDILRKDLSRLQEEHSTIRGAQNLVRKVIEGLETAVVQATEVKENSRMTARHDRLVAEEAHTKAISAAYEASFAEEAAIEPVEAAQMRVELVPNDFRQVVASQIHDGLGEAFRGESGKLNIDKFEKSMLNARRAMLFVDMFTTTKLYLDVFDPRNYEDFVNTTEKTRTTETMYVVNGFDHNQASIAKSTGPLTRTEQQSIADTLYTWMDKTIDQFLELNPTVEEIAQLIEYASYYDRASIKGRGVEWLVLGLHQKLLERGVKQARSAHEFAQLFTNRAEKGRLVVDGAAGFIRTITILEQSVAYYNFDRFLDLDPTLDDVRLLMGNLSSIPLTGLTSIEAYVRGAHRNDASHDPRAIVEVLLTENIPADDMKPLIKLFARELRMGRVNVSVTGQEGEKLEAVLKHNGYHLGFEKPGIVYSTPVERNNRIVLISRTVRTAVVDGTISAIKGTVNMGRSVKDQMAHGLRRALKVSGVAGEASRMAQAAEGSSRAQDESFAQQKAREFREAAMRHGGGKVRIK